jgi:hypothetical protein
MGNSSPSITHISGVYKFIGPKTYNEMTWGPLTLFYRHLMFEADVVLFLRRHVLAHKPPERTAFKAPLYGGFFAGSSANGIVDWRVTRMPDVAINKRDSCHVFFTRNPVIDPE